MDNRLNIERGDLTICYQWVPGEPADRWYPGARPYAEIQDVTWRGRPVCNIGNRNLDRLKAEIEATETAAYGRTAP